jgi:hypothetical protein
MILFSILLHIKSPEYLWNMKSSLNKNLLLIKINNKDVSVHFKTSFKKYNKTSCKR